MAFTKSGHPKNAIVLRAGSDSESQSFIPVEMVEKIKVLPQVERVNGVEMVSPEYLIPLSFKKPNGQLKVINVRGVDPIAFQVHPEVKMLRGKMPEHTAEGVILGSRLLSQGDVKEGGTVRIGKHRWPVQGVFSAHGTVFDSEVWCDKRALLDTLRKQSISAIYVTLSSPDLQPAFAADVGKINDFQMDAFSEPKFFERASETLEIYLQAVAVVVVLLSLGAIFACTNAMYAAFLGRMRELATLMAIGYTKRRVALLMLQESILFALVAGLLGFLIGMNIHGHDMAYNQLSLVYTAQVSVTTFVAAMTVSLVIGVVSGIASAFQTMRLEVLNALRAL
jgi:putative ABC transport system permease protein